MARIIVIDDDEQIRKLLRETLEQGGHEVITAANGDEGIRLQRDESAEVIITDILMPVKEGISTIHELRREFPEVKIIAISGGGQYGPLSHYLDMAKHIGAHRLIAKPFNRKQMLETVSELTGKKGPKQRALSLKHVSPAEGERSIHSCLSESRQKINGSSF